MMKSRPGFVALGLALTGAVLFGASLSHQTALAQSGSSEKSPVCKISPVQAINLAKTKVPGRALNANFEYDEGHWVYGVMVVSGKTIKEVEIDPVSGKIGDMEAVTPEGEAAEMKSELNKAIGNKSAAGSGSEDKGD